MNQNRIYQGDTLEYGVNVPDFLPSAGWSLKLYLRQRGVAGAPLSYTATPGPIVIDGVTWDYAFQIGQSTTAAWTAGQYAWAHKAEKSGQAHTLEGVQFQGELTVVADIASGSGTFDNRSQARKALDDLLALRATAASGGKWNVQEYRLGDRMMKFGTPVDLDNAISKLRAEVAREMRAEEIAKGLPDRRKILVRGTRA